MWRRKKEVIEEEEEAIVEEVVKPKRKYTRRNKKDYWESLDNGNQFYWGNFEEDFIEEEIEEDWFKKKKYRWKASFEVMFKKYLIVISKIWKYLRLWLKVPRACWAYNQDHLDEPLEHISKDTVYNWYTKDSVFKAMIDDCLDSQTIKARYALNHLINDWDIRAVLYELDRRDEDFKVENAMSLALQTLEVSPKTQQDIDDMLKKTWIIPTEKKKK